VRFDSRSAAMISRILTSLMRIAIDALLIGLCFAARLGDWIEIVCSNLNRRLLKRVVLTPELRSRWADARFHRDRKPDVKPFM
jgi:hypothetical protein